MLYDTKEYFKKYELMNTTQPDPDFTNHTFKATGWTDNVNIAFDQVINDRKKIEASPGYSRF